MIGSKNRFVGALLLVTGTTVGAGMLALPSTAGRAGFIPSVLTMFGVWLLMLLTALYLLEVNLRTAGENNLISMIRGTLGRFGEVIAWIVYLLLLYALTAAYTVGASELFRGFFGRWLPESTPLWIWPIVVFALFGTLVYLGTEVADLLNRLLMIGLVLGYGMICFFGVSNVTLSNLAVMRWPLVLPASAVILVSFGYHIIIPTLTTYLEHDAKQIRKAIVWGSLIAFAIYFCWQLLALGILPPALLEGESGEKMAMIYLIGLVNSPYLQLFFRLFTLFALLTSLLGVSLSLLDFLADGLRIKKSAIGRVTLLLMTFLPPLFFALFYPEGFVRALHYGGIFVAILLVLFPPLMAWAERRKLKEEKPFVPGGKPLLLIAIFLALFLLVLEVLY